MVFGLLSWEASLTHWQGKSQNFIHCTACAWVHSSLPLLMCWPLYQTQSLERKSRGCFQCIITHTHTYTPLLPLKQSHQCPGSVVTSSAAAATPDSLLGMWILKSYSGPFEWQVCRLRSSLWLTRPPEEAGIYSKVRPMPWKRWKRSSVFPYCSKVQERTIGSIFITPLKRDIKDPTFSNWFYIHFPSPAYNRELLTTWAMCNLEEVGAGDRSLVLSWAKNFPASNLQLENITLPSFPNHLVL